MPSGSPASSGRTRRTNGFGPCHEESVQAHNCLGLWGRYRGESGILHNLASLELLAGRPEPALELIELARALRVRPVPRGTPALPLSAGTIIGPGLVAVLYSGSTAGPLFVVLAGGCLAAAVLTQRLASAIRPERAPGRSVAATAD